MRFLLGLLFFTLATPCFSVELSNIYRSATSTGMGGIYTTFLDDEAAVFLNPAAMAGVEKKKFNYMTIDMDGSQPVANAILSMIGEGGSLPSIDLEKNMGSNYYGRAQMTPNLLMPNFGISLLLEREVIVNEWNAALPDVTAGMVSTSGVQAAFGMSVLSKGRRRRRSAEKADLRVGVGAKMLWRKGIFRKMSPIEVIQFTSVTDKISYLSSGPLKQGLGFDFGLQYILPMSKNLEFRAGASYLNVGGISFDGQSEAASENPSLGVGVSWKSGSTRVTAAYDIQNIFEDTDFRQKNHFGVEVALPVLSIYAGLNQAFFTYGASFDIWVLKVKAASYAQELFTLVNQNADRRFLVSIDLKIGF